MTTAAIFFSSFFGGDGGWVTRAVLADPGNMNDAEDKDVDDGGQAGNCIWTILLPVFDCKPVCLFGTLEFGLSDMSENSLNWVKMPVSKHSWGLTMVVHCQYSLWGMHLWSFVLLHLGFLLGVWIEVGASFWMFLFQSLCFESVGGWVIHESCLLVACRVLLEPISVVSNYLWAQKIPLSILVDPILLSLSKWQCSF